MTQPSSHTQPADSVPKANGSELHDRLFRALAPALAALVLDFADLITIGPLGLYGGLVIGTSVGWWMGGMHNFGRKGRLLIAVISGIYCMMPATHFLPLATMLSAIGRFIEEPHKNVS
ncbi:MAG: hypothetical protein ACI8TQ_000008 [Planctomycetota bacterium]|jgi:hypothetical protein